MLGSMPVYPRNTVFELLRPERTPDGQGGWIEVFEVQSESRGHMRPLSASEREAAAQLNVISTHRAYLHHTAVVRADYRIRAKGETDEYQVTWVREPGGVKAYTQVELVAVE